MKLTTHQRAAISSHKKELARHRKLYAAYLRYVDAARKLGFHPLDRDELDDRTRELDRIGKEYLTPEWADRAAFMANLGSGSP